jgi:hypothetical protein
MYEGYARRARVDTPHRRRRATARIGGRPDRVALWAVVLAFSATAIAATTAHAGSGGVSPPGGTASSYKNTQFGTRTLRMGMRGSDVRILNGILRSKTIGQNVTFTSAFKSPTDSSVRKFQRAKGLSVNGVVRKRTRGALVKSMGLHGATWYGPGFYGHRTACGQTLTTTIVGVANKTLPCGTKVTFGYHGRFIVARVIDRGPYTSGNSWDLTSAAAKKLGFAYSDQVRSAVAR